MHTTPVALERLSIILPFPRRLILVTLIPNRCGRPTAAIAALALVMKGCSSTSCPGGTFETLAVVHPARTRPARIHPRRTPLACTPPVCTLTGGAVEISCRSSPVQFVSRHVFRTHPVRFSRFKPLRVRLFRFGLFQVGRIKIIFVFLRVGPLRFVPLWFELLHDADAREDVCTVCSGDSRRHWFIVFRRVGAPGCAKLRVKSLRHRRGSPRTKLHETFFATSFGRPVVVLRRLGVEVAFLAKP